MHKRDKTDRQARRTETDRQETGRRRLKDGQTDTNNCGIYGTNRHLMNRKGRQTALARTAAAADDRLRDKEADRE